MSSTVGDRLVLIPDDVIGPVDVFGQLAYMAERAHPNRDGQQLVAELIAEQIEADPAFRRFLGAP